MVSYTKSSGNVAVLNAWGALNTPLAQKGSVAKAATKIWHPGVHEKGTLPAKSCF